MSIFRTHIIVILLLSVTEYLANCQEDSIISVKQLMAFSLEDLQTVKVKGIANLTELKTSQIPATLTTITTKQIEQTPARNIYDLIEVYVPGAMWLNHTEGPKLGMRGLRADRNYKILILINGRPINDKHKLAANAELNTWDLNDIEKIEIINGPGSVIHGPGAVEGVVNIITKTASQSETINVQAHLNATYNMKGGNISYAQSFKKLSVYTYGGLYESDGYENPDYFVPNPNKNTPYYGKASEDSFNIPPYFSAEKISPLIKAHLDVTYNNNLRFWARYNKTGSYGAVWRPFQNKNQTALANLEYTAHVNTKIRFDNTLSFSSQSYSAYPMLGHGISYNKDLPNDTYSENEILARSIFKHTPFAKLEYAIGAEYYFNFLRPAWNTPVDKFHFWERLNFVSDTNSYKVTRDKNGNIRFDKNEFIGNGWNTHMFSLFGEGNYKPTTNINLLLSARLDKHTWSNFMISPRFAGLYEINSWHNIKLIAQQSVRMLTIPILYLSDLHNEDVKPEVVRSIELGYQFTKRNISLTACSFYNDVDIAGFTGADYSTGNIGYINIFGIELNAKIIRDSYSLGINHAFVDMTYFKMIDEHKDGTKRQGISFSDYYYNNFDGKFNGAGVEPYSFSLTSYGHDLNNWANHQTKLYGNISILRNFNAHINSQIYWGMPGSKNELKVYENAFQDVTITELSQDQLNFHQEKEEEFNMIKKQVEESSAYDIQINLNASLKYTIPIGNSWSFYLIGYLQSIPINGKFKRAMYSTGSSQFYPNRLMHAVEPMSFGFKIGVKYD